MEQVVLKTFEVPIFWDSRYFGTNSAIFIYATIKVTPDRPHLFTPGYFTLPLLCARHNVLVQTFQSGTMLEMWAFAIFSISARCSMMHTDHFRSLSFQFQQIRKDNWSTLSFIRAVHLTRHWIFPRLKRIKIIEWITRKAADPLVSGHHFYITS